MATDIAQPPSEIFVSGPNIAPFYGKPLIAMSKRTKTTAVATSSSLDLICGLCDESYNDTTRAPLNLGCGHTYCAECLGKMVETKGRGASARQQLVCPMDSSVTPLAARADVLSLPKNYPLAELVAAAGGASAASLPAPAAAVAPPPVAIQCCLLRHQATAFRAVCLPSLPMRRPRPPSRCQRRPRLQLVTAQGQGQWRPAGPLRHPSCQCV